MHPSPARALRTTARAPSRRTRLDQMIQVGLLLSTSVAAAPGVLAAPPAAKATAAAVKAAQASTTTSTITQKTIGPGGQVNLAPLNNSAPAGANGQNGNDDFHGNGYDAPTASTPNGWNITVTNAPIDGNNQSALSVQANGARGGNGGQAWNNPILFENGGNAANGTAGGSTTITTDNASVLKSMGGATTLQVQANGGDGGNGGQPANIAGKTGQGGAGGIGGAIELHIGGDVRSETAGDGKTLAPSAIVLTSIGGNGGGTSQDTARTAASKAVGNAGGNGGNGGAINVYAFNPDPNGAGTTISSTGAGIVAVSAGGNGGWGAEAIATGSEGATSGSGGTGGTGGKVNIVTGITTVQAQGVQGTGTAEAITVDPKTPSVQAASSFVSAAILAQSFGGDGGFGGGASGFFGGATGHPGGNAGAGGQISVNTAGSIQGTGYGTAAIVAQSVGGSGGDGAGAGSVSKAKAGSGGLGGDGDTVYVETDDLPNAAKTGVHAQVSTHGDDSNAIMAQSIGGGGGNGGTVSVGSGLIVPLAIAIGGNGEQAGNGGVAEVQIGSIDQDDGSLVPGAVVSTKGLRSAGVLAQSIGGGGGNGGSATATTTAGVLSLSIGGKGGTGGDGGVVIANNYGVIQTDGQHSAGIVAQSIGGGGGNGGSASSMDAGVQIVMAVAVGGNGGTGGNAGPVTVSNAGQITTMQADSYGVLAQSVARGGGNGGGSWAETLDAFNDPDGPSLIMTTAVGGNGGKGGAVSGAVTATNSGSIVTQGASSIGLYGQSVGGGGGNGGSSGVTSVSTNSATVTLDVGSAGKGGSGGQGGDVTLTNDKGLIMTLGDSAIGMFGQSLGGAGGNGGSSAIDSSPYLSSSKTVVATVAIGGSGGSGNTGGNVTLNNTGGSISTRGDKASGMVAQSIGGNGGTAGAASAGGTGGQLTVNVSVGGNGGSGNNGGTATATNTGAILTQGGSANGMLIQSVGGDGGIGGASASGSGTDPELRASDYIASGLGVGAPVTTMGDNIYMFVKDEFIGDRAIAAMKTAATDYVQQNPPTPKGADGDGSWTINVDIGASVAGKGGSGGNGNTVTGVNSGAIETEEGASVGIFATSVGGSGGIGGAAESVNNSQSLTGLSDKNVPISLALAVGGGGGSAGDGGQVKVTNDGTIVTHGAASHGIVASSIGGGGGSGGATIGTWKQIKAASISIGGSGGATGDGQAVTVGFNSSTSAITTSGNDAFGVVAQSIGGGGGMATLMTTTQDGDTGGTMHSDISFTPNDILPSLLPISLNGAPGTAGCGTLTQLKVSACGNGGTVDVGVRNVTTTGAGAIGVFAQSIGGGGGLVLGASSDGNVFGTSAAAGNASAVTVKVGTALNGSNVPGVVSTSGEGAYGVVAQSVGGSGVLAGQTFYAQGAGAAFTNKNNQLNGDGGDVGVTIDKGSSVLTTGDDAHAVIAQSVGGGGGLVATSSGLLMGTAGGVGKSGNVTVTNNGLISASGARASAVLLDSDGQSGNTGTMTLNNNQEIRGNNSLDTAAVKFVGNGSRTVNNSGLMTSTNGWLIDGSGGDVTIKNAAAGQMYGNVTIGKGTFTNDGVWGTNDASTGNVVSTGQILIWGANFNQKAVSKLDGNLTSSGIIQTPVDFANKQAGVLVVNGSATINGGELLLVRGSSALAPNPVTVLSAGSLSVSSLTVKDDGGSGAYGYEVQTGDNTLTVTPVSQLSKVAQAKGFSNAEKSLAAHLDASFVPGATPAMQAAFGRLAATPTSAALQSQIDRLGNESIQSVGTAVLSGSNAFMERLNSCPQFDNPGAVPSEHDCAWSRVDAQDVHRDGSGSAVGYKQQNYLGQVGGQRRISSDWLVGGSVGYQNLHLNGDVGQSVSGRNYAVGVVAKHELDNWVLVGGADFGRGSYTSQRQTIDGDAGSIATGEFSSTHFGLHARASRQWNFDQWYVKPYNDVHLTWLRTSGYTETGAKDLDLHVAAESDTILSGSPMVEFGRSFAVRNATVATFVGFGTAWSTRNDWSARSSLDGTGGESGSFRSSASLPGTRAKLSLGADLRTASAFDVRLEYTGEFASGYQSHAASVKMNWLF